MEKGFAVRQINSDGFLGVDFEESLKNMYFRGMEAIANFLMLLYNSCIHMIYGVKTRFK